jgi:hypothetical protein
MSRHAFLIMAHKNFEQVSLLLQLLDDARFDIYLHVDNKVKDVPWESMQKSVTESDLTFLHDVDVAWGDSSQIRCEQVLINAAMQSGRQYSYLHLLSGQDLPLRTNDEICRFFEQHVGRQFVSIGHTDIDDSLTFEDLSKYHTYRMFGKKGQQQPWRKMGDLLSHAQMLLGVNRDKSCALKHGKGANWFSITGDFAQYVLDHWSITESHFMSRTLCCDELFLQTILLNSPFSADRYINEFDSDPHQTMRLIDWNRGAPYIYRLSDFEELMDSGCLFARKFDTAVDARIVEKIASTIAAK